MRYRGGHIKYLAPCGDKQIVESGANHNHYLTHREKRALWRVLLPSCQHPDSMFIHLNMLPEFCAAKCNMMTSQTAHAVPISLLDHDVENFRQHNMISRSIRQHVVKLQHTIAI
jgi:hypothetical protein